MESVLIIGAGAAGSVAAQKCAMNRESSSASTSPRAVS